MLLGFLGPPGQVARHIFEQIVTANQDEHLPRLTGHEDGGLAGGVAATDDHHYVLAMQHPRFVWVSRRARCRSPRIARTPGHRGGEQPAPVVIIRHLAETDSLPSR